MYRALAERLHNNTDLWRQVRIASFAYELNRLGNTDIQGDDRRRGREYLRLITSRYNEVLAVPANLSSHLQFLGDALDQPAMPVFTPCYESDCEYCAAPDDGEQSVRPSA